MIIHCPQCNRDIEAPNTALGKRVQCPLCGQAFTATLPKARVMEDVSPTSLEPPPPGFADYHPPQKPDPKPSKPKDLVAQPVDEDDADVIELTEVVAPPAAGRRTTGPAAGPSEIVDILQGRGAPDEGPMSDTLAALHGGAPVDRHIDDEEDDGPEVIQTDLAEEEVDEALSALAGAGASTVGQGDSRRAKANQWYVVSEEVEFGPYSGQAILAAVRAGKLTPQMILHDGAAEVEVSVAQLLQAMLRQGASGPPGQARLLPKKAIRLAPDGTSGASSSPKPAGPGPGSTPSAPASDAGALAQVALAARAAFTPASIPKRLPWALSDSAVLLSGLALTAATAGLLLPWLTTAPSIRTGLRLGDLARPWAYAFAGLCAGGLLLVAAMLIARRWRGRRLACGCLVVLCLASLVVQALALSDIREMIGGVISLGALGTGAWLAAAGTLVAGVLGALAAVLAEPRG